MPVDVEAITRISFYVPIGMYYVQDDEKGNVVYECPEGKT